MMVIHFEVMMAVAQFDERNAYDRMTASGPDHSDSWMGQDRRLSVSRQCLGTTEMGSDPARRHSAPHSGRSRFHSRRGYVARRFLVTPSKET